MLAGSTSPSLTWDHLIGLPSSWGSELCFYFSLPQEPLSFSNNAAPSMTRQTPPSAPGNRYGAPRLKFQTTESQYTRAAKIGGRLLSSCAPTFHLQVLDGHSCLRHAKQTPMAHVRTCAPAEQLGLLGQRASKAAAGLQHRTERSADGLEAGSTAHPGRHCQSPMHCGRAGPPSWPAFLVPRSDEIRQDAAAGLRHGTKLAAGCLHARSTCCP